MDLYSVGEVSAAFGVPVSTLHYWESHGLITPFRRSTWRYYGADQLYRIALIRRWREVGQLSIDEIAALLSSHEDAVRPDGWRGTVAARIETIDAQVAELHAARAYLEHLLTCRHDGALDECPRWRAEVRLPLVPVAG
jgi:DNA-binding transcriptional MerR regulator